MGQERAAKRKDSAWRQLSVTLSSVVKASLRFFWKKLLSGQTAQVKQLQLSYTLASDQYGTYRVYYTENKV
jgi:hypothetical protein